MIKKIGLIITIVFFQFEILFPLTGQEIMGKVYNRDEGKSIKMVLEMTLVNRMGRKRVRVFSVIRKSDKNSVKSLFQFNSPSDVKGVKFLSIDPRKSGKESRRWLYMPSLKRVQRVSGSSRNDYFMGSDLTYNDLRKRHADEETHKLTGTAKIGNEHCWVVESHPKGKRDIYDKRISYIGKNSFVPLMVEYFNKKGEKVKILKIEELEKIKSIWIVKKLEMENLHKKHKTVVAVKKLSLNIKIDNSLFSPARIERVKIH